MTAESTVSTSPVWPGRPELDESGVLALAVAGDREAYGALFDIHFEPLYGFAAAATLTVEDAEAVTTRTFEGVLAELHDDPGDMPFKVTLFRRAIQESNAQATLEPIGSTPTGHPEVWQQFTREERHVLSLAYELRCSREEISEILDIAPEHIDEIIDNCRSRINPVS